MDFHRLARFAPVADSPGPAQEHELALEFLTALYKRFPNATEVSSNHNSRYLKRASDAGLPSAFLRSHKEIMQQPDGWTLHDWVEIDGVVYEHGDRFGGQSALRQAVSMGAAVSLKRDLIDSIESVGHEDALPSAAPKPAAVSQSAAQAPPACHHGAYNRCL